MINTLVSVVPLERNAIRKYIKIFMILYMYHPQAFVDLFDPQVNKHLPIHLNKYLRVQNFLNKNSANRTFTVGNLVFSKKIGRLEIRRRVNIMLDVMNISISPLDRATLLCYI